MTHGSQSRVSQPPGANSSDSQKNSKKRHLPRPVSFGISGQPGMEVSQPNGVLSPPPLHIVKRRRDKFLESINLQNTDTASNESLRSAPEGQEFDRPLTVAKKRGNRSSKLYSSEESEQSFGDIALPRISPDIISYLVDATPRAGSRTLSGRSSSYHAIRTHTSKLLTKPQSFSDARVVSSEATCRRHDSPSRKPSVSSGNSLPLREIPQTSYEKDIKSSFGSGSSDALYDPEPIMPLGYDGFEDHGCHELSNYRQFAHESDGSVLHPYLLVPRISITPEVSTLDDGQTTVWAAIEVSSQLCCPYAANCSNGTAYTNHDGIFPPIRHCDAGLARYGYLYDVRIDVLPSAGSSLLDLLNVNATRVISLSSSYLTLAHVRLDPSPPRKQCEPQTTESNILIAELEYQLGDVKTEYIKVCLSYCHSGFPTHKNVSPLDGISNCQTRLETVASGFIKRYTPSSAWCPRLIPPPVSSNLSAIIASHWGPVKANEIMLRIATSRPTPRKVATSRQHTARGDETFKPPERTTTAPPLRVPKRQASLTKTLMGQDDGRARKIWSQMRRASSNNRPSCLASRVGRAPPTSRTESSLAQPETTSPMRDAERQQGLIREIALYSQRPLGTDNLRSLVPSPVYKGELSSLDPGEMTPPASSSDIVGAGSQRDGRWSLVNWW